MRRRTGPSSPSWFNSSWQWNRRPIHETYKRTTNRDEPPPGDITSLISLHSWYFRPNYGSQCKAVKVMTNHG